MSKLCCVLGCDRAAKPHYTRCDDCVRALFDGNLRKPEPPIEIRRAERFRLVAQ